MGQIIRSSEPKEEKKKPQKQTKVIPPPAVTVNKSIQFIANLDAIYRKEERCQSVISASDYSSNYSGPVNPKN